MRPLSLRMENTYSHENSYINFRHKKVCLIVGEIDGVRGNSNTAGKTSIINAIVFCLFGVSASGINRVVRDFTDYCKVTFIFRGDDKNVYKVERIVKLSKNGSVTTDVSFYYAHVGPQGLCWARKDNEMKKGKSGVQEEIEKVVGMDEEVFRYSVRLQQKEIGIFASAPPVERRNVLKKLIDMSRWDRLEQIAKVRTNITKTLLETEKSLLEDLVTRIEDIQVLNVSLFRAESCVKESIERKNKNIESLKDIEKRLEKIKEISLLEDRLRSSRLELKTLKDLIQQIEDSTETTKRLFKEEVSKFKEHAAQESQLRERLAHLNERLVKSADVVERHKQLDLNIKELRDSLSAKQKALAVCQSQMMNLVDSNKRIKGLDGECPTCFSKICEEHKQKITSDLKLSYTDFKSKKDLLIAEVSSFEQKLEEAGKTDQDLQKEKLQYVKIKSDITNIETDLKNINDTRDALKKKNLELKDHIQKSNDKKQSSEALVLDLENKILDQQSQVSVVRQESSSSLEIEQKNIKTFISDAEQSISFNQKLIGEITNRIVYAQQLSKNIEDKTNNITALQKEFNTRKLMEKSLGKQGIQAIILENSINYFEVSSRKWLKRFTNGKYDIKFETTVSNKKNDNIRETLDILIDKGNSCWHPYESFSGGESMKIDVALRVGLALAAASYNSVKAEYLYIDEMAGALDEFQRKAFTEMIVELSKDFELILVITHYPEIQEQFRDVITVKKTGYISTIVDKDKPEAEDLLDDLKPIRTKRAAKIDEVPVVDNNFCLMEDAI